ncbi:MAG: nicotinate (nicotinamide) nucleotide adenylyltransferase [Saprospiraceae bacterium]|nr:nicotinate (nicotinamide) nucleotide adenylyltransferase [Pyrinomonadaceae bacterium]
MKRIAFYGGSFDPVHLGHTTIAGKLSELFGLEEFIFIPAFHAPHKPQRKPTSAFHRHTMLCLATRDEEALKVSSMELDLPAKPYTVETLARLKEEFPEAHIFFVMGADSWQDILTWREWEKVLSMSSHIVVTRPGYEINFFHVTGEIRNRIVDLRSRDPETAAVDIKSMPFNENRIFITDAVEMDISATKIRQAARDNSPGWQKYVPGDVAKYIEKYQIYK